MLKKILSHEGTKPFFPTYIKRKSSDNGLFVFFNGTPDVLFSELIREKYIDSEKWEGMKNFPVSWTPTLEQPSRPQQACGSHNIYL